MNGDTFNEYFGSYITVSPKAKPYVESERNSSLVRPVTLMSSLDTKSVSFVEVRVSSLFNHSFNRRRVWPGTDEGINYLTSYMYFTNEDIDSFVTMNHSNSTEINEELTDNCHYELSSDESSAIPELIEINEAPDEFPEEMDEYGNFFEN